MNKMLLLKTASAALLLTTGVFLPETCLAGVVTDGSLGAATSLSGPNYAIGSTLGQVRGNNLFHSFSQFNLSASESATFSGPANITNIISRVSNGAQSSIDGTVGSSIAGANLYLINPSGIVLGPNATLNVSGSFYATTADYLKLGPTGRFEAVVSGGSNLTVDPPSAFGFLKANPASIAVNGSLLTVPVGREISLVAGDITVANGNLWAPGGTVNLVSAASAGEALYSGGNITLQGFSSLGRVEISENRASALQPVYSLPGIPSGMAGLRTANIDASGSGGGKIYIRGGSFYLSGGTVYNDSYGATPPRSTDIISSDSVTIVNSATITSNSNSGADASAPINISGSDVKITDSKINTDSFSSADGADMTITASSRLIIDGTSVVSTDADAPGSRSGMMMFSASDIAILGQAIVSSSAPVSGAGGAGAITVAASEALTITGQLRSDTFDGNSGAITINTGDLNVNDHGLISTNLSVNPAITARTAGDIIINADNINLSNYGSIGSNVLFSASGNGGNIAITSNNLNLSANAVISTTNDSATGSGGNILISNAGLAYLLGSDISTSATKFSGSGNGGNVTLNSGYLSLNSGRLTAQASFGNGGNLLLTMGKMFVKSTDSLVSASSRYGAQGTVVINAPAIDIAGALAAPKLDFVDLNAFLLKRCLTPDEGNSSSFRLLGNEGLPASPENSFPSSF